MPTASPPKPCKIMQNGAMANSPQTGGKRWRTAKLPLTRKTATTSFLESTTA